jgi:hypothetical protein
MSRVLPLAGFQVGFIGRFWVITEDFGLGICAEPGLEGATRELVGEEKHGEIPV